MTDIPIARIEWRLCYRIIPSRFPPTSREHPGNASNGCIVLDLNHRKMISESEDQILEVYP
jgi:hypothetical protein